MTSVPPFEKKTSLQLINIYNVRSGVHTSRLSLGALTALRR